VCNATPGLPADEACNTIDDDCDGFVDDNLTRGTTCGVGACAGNTGIETCTSGTWGGNTCDPLAGATPDTTCDGADQDCDGLADDAYIAPPTTCGVGACVGNTGVLSCVSGATVDTCDPLAGATAELCDTLDNDCDGAADDGYDVGAVCTNGVGACERPGNKVCSPDGSTTLCNAIPGTPTDEVCNGLDDNCDTIVDNAPVPTEATHLWVERGVTVTFLEWFPIGDASGYDLVRGLATTLSSTIGNFTAATQACLANNTPGTAFIESQTPAAGESFWYLVRGQNCGGPGSYDETVGGQIGSRDAEINASPNACP
jgi:hypothetical protein